MRSGDPASLLQAYRADLGRLRREFGSVRDLPDVPFFLFGMGPRKKMVYRAGLLRDALTGEVLYNWNVAAQTIVPPEYAVHITTSVGQAIHVVEDEAGVWLEVDGERQALAQSHINLPSFDGHPYASVLRVLHQETLVNIVGGLPVPNFFVYRKPWYRDGALMGMVLRETGNLDLIRDWILGLREPYDRNNGGETEADNLGQGLYLASLVADRSHPLVPAILQVLPGFETGGYIRGRSDFAERPVYQTKWAKFGLAALGLDDPYEVPLLPDAYSALFWWAYKDRHVDDGSRFDEGANANYPYLGWAEDHFYGARTAPVGNRDYPLTWEAYASQADYDGMALIAPAYVQQKLCVPHTWHAAEMLLYLLELA